MAFMLPVIHSTAIIHPQARIDPSAEVGPYAVIDAGVTLGAGCWLGPFVHLTGETTIGTNNRFHAGCVLGDAPQDLKYAGVPTRLRIGDGNVFRENVTVHRATKPDGETVIGSGCFLMAGAHVGHNSEVGNHVIIANGVSLGGHVTVHDRAFLSGNCLVHQFVRVGTLALMQGGSAISKDLPPFTIARRQNSINGLNIIGMRRAGFSAADRLELKQLYHALFRSGLAFRAAIAAAQDKFHSVPSRTMLDFLSQCTRGAVMEVNRPGAGRAEPEE
jgi:UDP-N-acetylglucosamine acyltransferase